MWHIRYVAELRRDGTRAIGDRTAPVEAIWGTFHEFLNGVNQTRLRMMEMDAMDSDFRGYSFVSAC